MTPRKTQQEKGFLALFEGLRGRERCLAEKGRGESSKGRGKGEGKGRGGALLRVKEVTDFECVWTPRRATLMSWSSWSAAWRRMRSRRGGPWISSGMWESLRRSLFLFCSRAFLFLLFPLVPLVPLLPLVSFGRLFFLWLPLSSFFFVLGQGHRASSRCHSLIWGVASACPESLVLFESLTSLCDVPGFFPLAPWVGLLGWLQSLQERGASVPQEDPQGQKKIPLRVSSHHLLVHRHRLHCDVPSALSWGDGADPHPPVGS